VTHSHGTIDASPMRSMSALGCALLLGLVAACAPPDEVPSEPGTDLQLVEIWSDQGEAALATPVNLTDRDGYDNQPHFLPDGQSFLYSSRRDGNIEIMRYDMATRTSTRLTRTAESEYSPTPLPDGDGFAVVRVVEEGRQELWRFDVDGGNPTRLLDTPDLAVGYFAWGDPDTLAMFHVENRPTLHVARVAAGTIDKLADDIGRSLQPVPGRRAISFVHKLSASEWWVTELDLDSGALLPIAPTVQGVEDHAWLPSGELLMAQGARIFWWQPGEGAAWKQIADFSDDGVTGISRIGVSPLGDQLVIVTAR